MERYMKRLVFPALWGWAVALSLAGCSEDNGPQAVPETGQPETVNELLDLYNRNIAACQLLADGRAEVVDYVSEGEGAYKLRLDDGTVTDIRVRAADENDIPLLGIGEDGYWHYRLRGEEYELEGISGEPAPALLDTGKPVLTPRLSLDEDGCWQVSYNGVQWMRLSDAPAPSLAGKTESAVSLYSAVSLDEESRTLALTPCLGEAFSVGVQNDGTAEAWKRFLTGSADNVLLDYSYAGYDRGETAPKDGFAWGYTVYNVKEYMAENGLSAIDAFIDILDKNGLIRKTNSKASNANARIVIYFPEGEYILHNGEAGENSSSKKVFPYDIIGGNFIIKGDGPDKTRLVMKGSNGGKLAGGGEQYDVAPLLTIKSYSGSISPTEVTADAVRGTSAVEVADASGFKPGDWVELRLRSNDPELVAEELGPITPGADWAITKSPASGGTYDGVYVREYHQVKSVSGNRVVFYEPMMHDVEVKYKDYDGGWKLYKYRPYENVGIEDLAFVGNSVTPYYHHGSGAPAEDAWKHDSEYKMIVMMRTVNSWVRNVDFENVSEAVAFTEAANCSAYNIAIRGNRGHDAVRSHGSTRIFMGAVRDESRDAEAAPGKAIGEGQWHGCGVSKPSIGTVVWRSTWGANACFESHASQPRATLFDCCSGGLVYYHEGGDDKEAPNHLSDLTLWNLNVTGTTDENNKDYSASFKWWDNADKWWKIYPPIVVGTHGKPVSFSQEEGQLTYEESTGVKVSPESLYEAQLEKRLGFVPAWLQELK